jgi:UDP-GlcNAc3NAcA epimerase
MKIATIVGARPQFVKAAPVSRTLRKSMNEVLINTGQHYDYLMSKVFFDQLGIPTPDYNLEVGSGSHGMQTGLMLQRIEEVLLTERPDAVLVYGDTNSTLAGAIAASKLHIPIAHVEAGLRSFNRKMPEEINRLLTDNISNWLFCPTDQAMKNLQLEGITLGVANVGDVMYEGVLACLDKAKDTSSILVDLALKPNEYYLATIHRAENTDDVSRIQHIITALGVTNLPVVLPLHPRTRSKLSQFQLEHLLSVPNLKVIDPVGYFDMLALEASARKIVTDSGGIQKEAYFLGVPCVTLRDETEWIETVAAGWNVLVGADEAKIIAALASEVLPQNRPLLYGDGSTSELISKLLLEIR